MAFGFAVYNLGFNLLRRALVFYVKLPPSSILAGSLERTG